MVVAWISGTGGLWAYLTKTNDLFSTKTEEKIGTHKTDGKLHDLQDRLIGGLAKFKSLQPSGKAMERLTKLAS